jgi:hypothetical protein
MTRAIFLELVLGIVKARGRPWATDVATQRGVLNERLFSFCAETWCLRTDTATVNLVANQGIYSMASAFSVPLVSIARVVMNKVPLHPKTIHYWAERSPTYQTDTQTYPTEWAYLAGGDPSGQDAIRLYPAPSGNVSAAGPITAAWAQPALSLDLADDNTPISIPQDYQFTAAVYTAVQLLYPNSGGKTDLELMAQLDQSAAAKMRELASRAFWMSEEPLIRGARDGHADPRTVWLTGW